MVVIKKIAVLGAGTMGAGIALFFAQKGFYVTVYDPDQKALAAARVKARECAADMERGQKEGRMLITHFFNPAHLIPLVEVVKTDQTDPGLAEEIAGFLGDYGKEPVVLKKDVFGFIANRLQAAVFREAFSLLEKGVADARQIDIVMKEGIGIRWALNGPFEIADFGGLDIWERVLANLLPDLADTQEVSGILTEKVARRELGLKTGKGFFDYSSGDSQGMLRNRKLALLLASRGKVDDLL